MKITVFNAKGGVGKTPISYNIAKDCGYGIATNETYNVLDRVFPEDNLLVVPPNEEFPELPDEMNVVFDLGGAIGTDSAPSILSAVKMSDIVLVPVENEYKAINGAFHSIEEILPHNPNVAIIVTKLEKRRGEIFSTWNKSTDFNEVTTILSTLFERNFPAYPLKLSKVFRHIFEREMSVAQICSLGGVDRYHFKQVQEQFNEIYKFINGGNYGGK